MGNLLSTPRSNTRSPLTITTPTSLNASTTAREASSLINRQLGTSPTMIIHTTALVATTTNTAPRTLDTLPIEIFELVSTELPSLKDLQSLRLTSRALRRKSEYPFGTRYFSHLLFHMHPSNLRALSDLSTTQMARYFQVLGIQLPKFNALRPGLIDLMHDPTAVNNSISRGPNGDTHNDTNRPVKTVADLCIARNTADIIVIAQALFRMLRLREVRTGNFVDSEHQCRSHRRLFHIIVAAIANIPRPVGEEIALSIAVNSFSHRNWDLNSSTKTLLAQTKNRAQISFDDPEKTTHCDWLSDANLEALELQYRKLPDDTFPAIAPPFKSLTIFQGCFSTRGKVSGLTAMLKPMTESLVAFLDHHANSLETVRLLQRQMTKSKSVDEGMWKAVVTKLKEMPKLVLLELRELKSDRNDRDHLDEEASKKEDVVVHWQWRKDEVQRALLRLEETYQTVTANGWCLLNLHVAI